jgi:hypothetical protein
MAKWMKLTNIGSGLEADLMVERLRGAGLHARSVGDAAMFGAGFQGTTARGFDVFVLGNEISKAREILDEMKESAEDSAPNDTDAP